MAVELRNWADKLESLGYKDRAEFYRNLADEDEKSGLIPLDFKIRHQKSESSFMREQELILRTEEMGVFAEYLREGFGGKISSDIRLRDLLKEKDNVYP